MINILHKRFCTTFVCVMIPKCKVIMSLKHNIYVNQQCYRYAINKTQHFDVHRYNYFDIIKMLLRYCLTITWIKNFENVI